MDGSSGDRSEIMGQDLAVTNGGVDLAALSAYKTETSTKRKLALSSATDSKFRSA
jgi:hypothetical protein